MTQSKPQLPKLAQLLWACVRANVTLCDAAGMQPLPLRTGCAHDDHKCLHHTTAHKQQQHTTYSGFEQSSLQSHVFAASTK